MIYPARQGLSRETRTVADEHRHVVSRVPATLSEVGDDAVDVRCRAVPPGGCNVTVAG